jgi:hypothetical protein
MRIGLPAQDHAEGGARFLARQGTRPAGATPEGGDKGGELGFG